MAAVICATCFVIPASAVQTLEEKYDKRMAQVSELLLNDSDTVEAVKKLGRATVYISVSDGENRAVTVWSSTKKLSSALDKVLVKAKNTGVTPKWFKLEVVTDVQSVTDDEFKELVGKQIKSGLRRGISFNQTFGLSIPEGHINSEGMLDYETAELNLEKINAYFKRSGKKQLSEIPESFIVFGTQGYFSDGTAYKLLNGSRNSIARRDFPTDKAGLEQLAEMSSSYLADICGSDGKFIYGYYPIDNGKMDDYNIIRHAGTVWNLILQYDMTKNDELVPVIDRALDYLEGYIQYKDKNTAFLADSRSLNVGGNGISLLAYTAYADIFKTDKYNGLIKALANGIIFMQKDSGAFTHALKKSDYTVYKDYIVIFYDGEAMYGLCRAYGVLGTKKFLRAAEKAADYFIDAHYEKENSHWISYGFNELTKYSPKEKYFNFGLLNVHGFTKKAYKNAAGSPTRGETLGAAFELYDRLIQSEKNCEMLNEFDEDMLFKAFEQRIFYGLNYFMFPEYAMYFPDPQTVLNSFAVREDLFRIRIDDIQHFMGGYYLYWKNYDRVKYYTTVN